MEKSTKFWDRISKKYDVQVNAKYAQTYQGTINSTRKYLSSTDIVLDYACGTGITTIELAKSVKKIFAVDTSENMIKLAVNKTRERSITNVEYSVSDIYSGKLEAGSFSVILGFNILYFVKDIENVLDRINELLKPGGLFISATDCLGENESLVSRFQIRLSRIGLIPYMRLFKIKELEKVVEMHGFSILETKNLYSTPPNFYIAAKK